MSRLRGLTFAAAALAVPACTSFSMDGPADGSAQEEDAASDGSVSGLDATVEANVGAADGGGGDGDRGAADASSDASFDGASSADGAQANDGSLTDAGVSFLGAASTFVLLANTAITIAAAPPADATRITGNVGVYPGSTVAVFSAGEPMGNVYAGDAAGAQMALGVAYDALAAMNCPAANNLRATDLGGGLVLKPGVYCLPGAAALSATAPLMLDAQGDPNATWVFQIGGALTTTASSEVRVVDGGSACNVYWQITGAATIAASTKFAGNLLVDDAVTFAASATLYTGRAMSLNGAIGLTANTLSSATCK